MTTLDLVIRRHGRIAKITRARVSHRCAQCQEYILPRTQYYSVTVGGSGLGGIKFPTRVHIHCIDNYFEKIKRANEY